MNIIYVSCICVLIFRPLGNHISNQFNFSCNQNQNHGQASGKHRSCCTLIVPMFCRISENNSCDFIVHCNVCNPSVRSSAT